MSSAVPVGYTVITSKSPMIRATSECSVRGKGESFKGGLKRLRFLTGDSESPGWKLQVLD